MLRGKIPREFARKGGGRLLFPRPTTQNRGMLVSSLGSVCLSLLLQGDPTPPQPKCYPMRPIVRIDGDLADWDRRGPLRIESSQAPFVEAHAAASSAPPADGSLLLHFGFDRDALYIGGQVEDRDRVYDDRLWFNGDCIDLYLDTDVEGDRERVGFDDDDYEICFMPYNVGRPFGVVKQGRRSVLSDGGMRGVEVAARALGDEGYSFEIRLPFANFPRLERPVGLGAPPRLAFNLAWIDCDHAADGSISRAVRLLSPRDFAYLTTRGFLDLEFVGDDHSALEETTAERASRLRIWLIEIALALLLIVVTARYANAVFTRLEDRLARYRRRAVLTAVLAVVVLVGSPLVATRLFEMRGKESFEEVAGVLGRVIGGLAERESLGSDSIVSKPEDLLALVRGKALPVPRSWSYTCVDLKPGDERTIRRSYEGVPVREYGFTLPQHKQLYFPLPRPTALTRMFVFGRARFEGAAKDRPGSPALREDALEIGIRLVDGTLRTELFPVIDRTAPAARQISPSDRFALGYEGESGSVEQYFLGAPTIAKTLVQAIVITQKDPGVAFDLAGVTYCADDGSDTFTPLLITKPSLAGPPAAFFDGTPKGAEVALPPTEGANTFELGLDRRFDALWFFYDSLDPRALDPALRGVEVGRFVAIDDRGREHVASLRAGVNLFPGLYDAAKRRSDSDSRVAFRWLEEPGATRHLEMLELGLPADATVTRFRFENKGPLSAITLYAVTGGVRSTLEGLENGTASAGERAFRPLRAASLEEQGGELRLAEDAAARFEDSRFAVLVDDAVAVSDFQDEAQARSLIGARPPLGEEVSAENESGQRVSLFGEPFRTRTFTLPRADGRDWKIVLFEPVPGVALAASMKRYGLILALLLGIPLLVLYALDFATRIARLGPRLTTLLVATSLTPIVVLFAVLYNLVADDRARLRESRADTAMREAMHRFEQYFAQTQQLAEQIVGSDAMRAVRPDAPIDETALRSYLADVVAVRGAAAQGVDFAVRLEIDIAGGKRLRFHDRPEGENMSRFDLEGRGVFLHWDKLVLLWTEDFPNGAFRRRVTVAAEVVPAVLRDVTALSGAEIALLAPDGRPLAGSMTLDSDLRPADVERLRRLNRAHLRVGQNGSLYVTQLLTVGVTNASQGAEAPALVQIALAPDEYLVDVPFARLPLESFFFWFCVIGLTAAVFMGSVATARITGPVAELDAAVRRVAAGEFDVAVRGGARGEVGRLAESFNTMASQLRSRAAERRRFERATEQLNASIELEPTATAALDVLCDGGPPVLACSVYVRDAENVRWQRVGTHARLDPQAPLEIQRSRVFDLALRRREPTQLRSLEELSGDGELTGFERSILESPRAVVLPLTVSDRSIGIAVLKFPATITEPDIESDRDTLIHLASQIAVSLENAKLYRLAVADPETGLFVESFLRSRFAEEIDRAQRRESRLALLLIGVDGLRRYERAHGRDAARDCVVRIARLLRAESRDLVLAGRFANGFALIVPESDRAQAEEFQRRLLRGFAGLDGGEFATQTGLHLHIGIALFPDDGASSAFVLSAAERAVAASRRAKVTEVLDAGAAVGSVPETDPHPYVFQSPAMRELLSQIARVAQSTASVLILGETGAGKEVVAELLHRFSDRAHKPFVAINCSAVPENLLEAELFGYERGAFTGALRAKPGQLELADGGTLFLDEIGDMPLALQSKLLRVLQDRLVVRLGSRRGTEVDVRIVAATNRDLRQMMEEERFRSDLYFRLKVVTLSVPPLRERREDLPGLVETFVRQFNDESGRPAKTISTATLDMLHGYSWPGNVRELRNVLQRALLMTEGDLVLPAALEFEKTRGEPPRGPESRPHPALAGVSSGESKEVGSRTGMPSGDGLNERQRLLLATLAIGHSIRSKDYFALVSVPERTGLRDLADLVERGVIVREGRRKAATYRLPDPPPAESQSSSGTA